MADDNWNELETTSTPSTTQNSQLILTNGQSASVMFIGAPHPFDAIYMDRGYVLATPALITQGKRVSKRAAVNVYMPETGNMLVFEQGTPFFNEVRALQNAYPFASSVFIITRMRVGDSTRHAAEFARPATMRERSAAASLARHDLARWVQETFGRTGGSTPPAAAPSPRVDRISPQDAANITTTLTSLAPAAMDDFLATFGVASVADLSVDQTAPARRYALALCTEYPLPSAGSTNNIM